MSEGGNQPTHRAEVGSCRYGSYLSHSTTLGLKTDLKIKDNTNADPDTRAVWVQLAQTFGVPIRCLHFAAPAKLCQHNDTVRALSDGSFNPEKRTILPHSAFAGFASRFKEPQVNEGFQDVLTVEFQVSPVREVDVGKHTITIVSD